MEPTSQRRVRRSKAFRAWIVERQGGDCAGCQEPLGRFLHLDHRIPFCVTYLNLVDFHTNLQALCGNCHTEKTGLEAAVHAKRRRLAGTSYDVCFVCKQVFSKYFKHKCYKDLY